MIFIFLISLISATVTHSLFINKIDDAQCHVYMSLKDDWSVDGCYVFFMTEIDKKIKLEEIPFTKWEQEKDVIIEYKYKQYYFTLVNSNEEKDAMVKEIMTYTPKDEDFNTKELFANGDAFLKAVVPCDSTKDLFISVMYSFDNENVFELCRSQKFSIKGDKEFDELFFKTEKDYGYVETKIPTYFSSHIIKFTEENMKLNSQDFDLISCFKIKSEESSESESKSTTEEENNLETEGDLVIEGVLDQLEI